MLSHQEKHSLQKEIVALIREVTISDTVLNSVTWTT